MLGFVRGTTDILLATTIIESGLDIPRANTIFIDEADDYGLADLHQLRGRVGRSHHRAWCYLLVDETARLTQTAAKRLRAIQEFSSRGAGFSLAMRDLEIRGAGNLLGTQQSGHIATVGYELYCRLLEQAVRGMKQMPPAEPPPVNVDLPGEAWLPRDYIPDFRAKIDVYRRLSRATAPSQVDDLATELTDRFGPLPDEAGRLLDFARLRVAALALGIDSITRHPGMVVIGHHDREAMERLRQAAAKKSRVVRVVDRHRQPLIHPPGQRRPKVRPRANRRPAIGCGSAVDRPMLRASGADSSQPAADSSLVASIALPWFAPPRDSL